MGLFIIVLTDFNYIAPFSAKTTHEQYVLPAAEALAIKWLLRAQLS